MSAPRRGAVPAIDSGASADRSGAGVLRFPAERPWGGWRYAVQALRTSAPLVAADLLALAASVYGASWLIHVLRPSLAPEPLALFAFLSFSQIVIYWLFGLYPGTGLHPVVELRQASIGTTLLFAAFFVADLLNRNGQSHGLVAGYLCAILAVPLARFEARSLSSRFDWWGQPLLVFGAGPPAVSQYQYFRSHLKLGLRPVGMVDDRRPEGGAAGAEPPGYLGSFDRAGWIARDREVFWAIVAMPERELSEVREVVDTHASGIPHVLVVSGLTWLPCLWNRVQDCGGALGIRMSADLLLPLPRATKRLMDIGFVVVGGLASVALITGIGVLIKLGSRGPIFYAQNRIGQGARRFRVWKFRTMVVDADKVLEEHLARDPRLREEWAQNHKLRDDPRVTWVGRLLRRTSLDELPQVWNIVRGEMSVVGPRPIVQAEISKYESSFELYTRVRPGITGLWQVSGRNHTTYPERVSLDSYYVKNWSPWLDLYILARTIKVVLRGEGAY
jgi:Undecaprenyl-phosphate galactose phosphotransferase WbaP